MKVVVKETEEVLFEGDVSKLVAFGKSEDKSDSKDPTVSKSAERKFRTSVKDKLEAGKEKAAKKPAKPKTENKKKDLQEAI
ncbi:MAG: hypothetical protein Q4E57_10300 [Eubacteriales bacterium]|nr:hypothetical protein [Eubacteriales bacterium]